jgi:acetoin utilization protein AcuB
VLLVKDSMTRDVVALSPGTTADEALALCREKRIRHLPVLEEGRLAGIVSDRDLRSAAPGLGDPGRAEALQNLQISDVMTRAVVITHPDDPIEEAADRMREKRIGCLPVVEDGDLLGILTSSDVMEALVQLTGAHEPGSRLVASIPDRPGTLAGAAGIFGLLGRNIVSVVAGPRQEPPPGEQGLWRAAIFRIDTIDPTEAIEFLERAGYTILWPPKQ